MSENGGGAGPDELSAALDADPLLAAFAVRVRALAGDPSPPSPALAHLLAVGRPPPKSARRRRAAVVSVIAAASALSATGAAAAADQLPDPLQAVVSDAVGEVTPFDIPSPAKTGPAKHHPPRHDRSNAPASVPPPGTSSAPATSGSDSGDQSETPTGAATVEAPDRRGSSGSRVPAPGASIDEQAANADSSGPPGPPSPSLTPTPSLTPSRPGPAESDNPTGADG